MRAYSYVRWSSAQQSAGDSHRRQAQLAVDWAKKNNVVLDKTSYQDHGISAFRGKNFTEGRLGAFLKAIDDGSIETPCYLLVEAMDRLSRNEIDIALELFLSIIRRGVTIITLHPEQDFSPAKIREDKGISLIVAIAMMVQANSDSSNRAARVKAAWDKKKKERSQGVIATRVGPSWLLKKNRTEWIVLKDKAAIVKRIFAMALAGHGTHVIAKTLNAEGVPNIGVKRRRNEEGKLVERENHWTQGNIAGLFRGECVFGRWRSSDGKDVVDGYYPEIVSKADYDAIAAARDKRRGKGGFNQGTTNIFSGITRCAYCGKALKVRRYKTTYLQCRNALHNACGAKRINYPVVESEILNYLIISMKRDMNPQKMEKTNKSARRELEQQITTKQAELEKLINLAGLVKTDVAVLADKLTTAQQELDSLQTEMTKLQGQSLSRKDIDDAVELFYRLTEESTMELRMEVMVQIRRQIRHIDVAPHLEEHSKHFAKFEVEKRPTSPLHMARITYVDGSVGLTDIVTG